MNIYLLRTYCEPDSKLGIGHKAVDKMERDVCPHGVSNSVCAGRGAQRRLTKKREWARCDYVQWMREGTPVW